MKNLHSSLLFSFVFILSMTCCKKGDDVDVAKIISTKETVLEVDDFCRIVVEATFEDESMMYFLVTSPATATVVDKHFFYGPDSNEGYVYRGNLIIPSEFTHQGSSYVVTETWDQGDFPAFGHSVALKTIVFPNTVKNIGGCMDCISLSSVVFGNSVDTICDRAFVNCKSLVSVELPNSLKVIGKMSFYDCISLSSITCLAPEPPVFSGNYGAMLAFARCPLETIRVPNESVSAYKHAVGWRIYADIIVGI